MGNTASAPAPRDLTATVTEICKATVPPDHPVWEGFWHHKAGVEQIFGLIQPDDVRAMRSRLPTNLCMLVIKLVEALERYSGRFSKQDSRPVLNIVRLLTRILPVLLENTEDAFTQRLLWDDQISMLQTAAGVPVSSATAPEQHDEDLMEVWVGVGDYLEQFLEDKLAAGSAAAGQSTTVDQPGTEDATASDTGSEQAKGESGGADSGAEAPEVTGTAGPDQSAAGSSSQLSSEAAQIQRQQLQESGNGAPLGQRLVYSVMRLLFTPEFTVSAMQFALFRDRFLTMKKQHADMARTARNEEGTSGGQKDLEKTSDESTDEVQGEQTSGIDEDGDDVGVASGGAAAAAASSGALASPEDDEPSAGTSAENGHVQSASMDEADGEPDSTPAKPVIQGEVPPFAPNLSNSIWPSLLWSGGVVFRSLSPPRSSVWEQNRTELLRLLIVCMSQPLYVDTGSGASARCPLYETAISPDCPMLPTLFFSLINTVVSFDPEGWGLPYVSAMEADSREPFIDASLQALLLLLDYRPPADEPLVRDTGAYAEKVREDARHLAAEEEEEAAMRGDGAPGAHAVGQAAAGPASGAGEDRDHPAEPAGSSTDAGAGSLQDGLQQESSPRLRPLVYNAYRGLMAGITDTTDFETLFGTIVRFLSNSSKSKQTVLPFSMKALGSHQEALLLLWHLLDSNRSFARHVVEQEDVCRLIRPLCYYLWRERLSKDWGTVHLICFILLFLSGYRSFCVQLNKTVSAAELPPMIGLPAFEGCHGDLLYLTAHKVLVNGSSNHRRMHSLLMLVLSNVSVFVKRVHMVTGTKIASLLTVLGDPSEVLRGPDSVLQLQRLLQMFRNVIQYQYDGHAYLIYALVKEAAILHRLETFVVDDVMDPLPEEASSSDAEGGDGQSDPGEDAGKGTSPDVVPMATDGVRPADGASPEEDQAAPADGEEDQAGADLTAQRRYREQLQTWLEEQQSMLPLREIKLALRHLRPRVMNLIQAGGGSVDDEAVLRCIQDDTLVGVLPRPHELVVERYSPTEDTQAWMQRNLWSVVYLRNLDLPFFDVRQIRMFTVGTKE